MRNPPMSKDRSALLVAHGSPSDPETQEAALQSLAHRVQALLPDWKVGSATLAAPGKFEVAAQEHPQAVIYPFFMARGWFTNKVLVERAAPFDLSITEPFGVEPALVTTAVDILQRALASRGWSSEQVSLLIAAHGSARSKTSSDSAKTFAKAISDRMTFTKIRCGFVEEAPFLKDAAEGLGQGVCLAFLALDAGHMQDDVPEALVAAGFDGPVLPPFIDWPETAHLIADSLQRYRP